MSVTKHPVHISGLALLTHPAPALGCDAKALVDVCKQGTNDAPLHGALVTIG